MPSQSEESECSGEAEAIHKRMIRREKMRRYRKRLAESVNGLKLTIATLEAEIGKFTTNSNETTNSMLLPWKHVAASLKDIMENSNETNITLKNQIRATSEAIHGLNIWIANRISIHTNYPSIYCTTWKDVTLLTTPDARLAGFEWMTQRLFNNTDWIFERAMLPIAASSTHENHFIDDFILDSSNPEFIQYVWRRRMDLNIPFETACEVFNLGYFHEQIGCCGENLDPSVATVRELDSQVLDQLGACLYTYHRGPTERVNVLSRSFQLKNRRVYVAQNVEDDERLGGRSVRQSRRQQWMILDKLSDTSTQLRYLFTNSQDFTSRGYVSLEEEAKGWFMESTESLTFESFSQYVRSQTPKYSRNFQRHMKKSINETL